MGAASADFTNRRTAVGARSFAINLNSYCTNVSGMNAPWVSVMPIGNLQLECGLLTNTSHGFPFSFKESLSSRAQREPALSEVEGDPGFCPRHQCIRPQPMLLSTTSCCNLSSWI